MGNLPIQMEVVLCISHFLPLARPINSTKQRTRNNITVGVPDSALLIKFAIHEVKLNSILRALSKKMGCTRKFKE